MKQIRHWVFWPPFLLFIVAVVASLIFQEQFSDGLAVAISWMLDNFGWLFNGGTFLMVLVCIWVMVSPLSKVRIGGKDAEPLLTRWQWFTITLCTTIAVGILFWGTAEPIMHLSNPPDGAGVSPNTEEAGHFSLATIFMHWSFTPYAIYAIPALMFALAFYNRKKSFSIGSSFFSLFDAAKVKGLMPGLDVVALYALVAGMAASLGAGILSLSGGLNHIFGWAQGPWAYALIGLAIVIVFSISSITGLKKGIRILSDWNMRVFILFAIFIFIAGPTLYILSTGMISMKEYLIGFAENSLFTADGMGSEWSQGWTIFYWANWLAWAPISALFLGRIAYGYTVREFMLFNWIIPALFAIVWMSIFSGTAIQQELYGGAEIAASMQEDGYQQAIYAVLGNLPWAKIMIPVFVIALFISFVTAADSTVAAMGGISSTGIAPESPEPPAAIKLLWGVLIGAVAVIMISFDDIEGVKKLSQLGGFPALFIILTITFALIKVLIKPSKYFQE